MPTLGNRFILSDVLNCKFTIWQGHALVTLLSIQFLHFLIYHDLLTILLKPAVDGSTLSKLIEEKWHGK